MIIQDLSKIAKKKTMNYLTCIVRDLETYPELPSKTIRKLQLRKMYKNKQMRQKIVIS